MVWKNTTFISPHKDELLSTSSSSGWRFNLSPDEWPTTSLSEAAEADCPESKGNSEMTGEFVSMISLSFYFVWVCEWGGEGADTGPSVEDLGWEVMKSSDMQIIRRENKTEQKDQFCSWYFTVWQCKMNAGVAVKSTAQKQHFHPGSYFF